MARNIRVAHGALSHFAVIGLTTLALALGGSGCDKRRGLLPNPLVVVYQAPVDLRKFGADYPAGFVLGGGGVFSTFGVFTSPYPEVLQPVDSYLVRLDRDGSAHPLTPVLGAGVRDPEVSWDGKRILFAMKRGVSGAWQVHEVGADGGTIQRISLDERFNDFDPAYLPNGDIVFLSDRPRLVDPIFHEPSAQLHRMRPNGSEVEQISVDPGGEFNPIMTQDGHLLFTQWNSHYKNFDPTHYEVQAGLFLALDRFLVWKIALDGTSNAHPFFGDHLIDDFTGGLVHVRETADGTGRLIGALVDARGTFGSGAIVRVDPSKNADQQKFEFLTPNVHLDHGDTVRGRYRNPYPLSDGRIIAAYAEGPVLEATRIPPAGPPGLAEGFGGTTRTEPLKPVQAAPPRFKLVFMPKSPGADPVVLHEQPDFWMLSPVELVARTPPEEAKGTARPGFSYGILNASDIELRDRNATNVQNGDDQPVPKAGEIAKLQVFVGKFVAAPPSVAGIPYRKVEERLLGEAPVMPDGSFSVAVPANVPLFWRTVRADGSPVVEDPFFTQVRPGQVITCNGCHSPHDGSRGRTSNLAQAEPSNLAGVDLDTDDNGVVDLFEPDQD